MATLKYERGTYTQLMTTELNGLAAGSAVFGTTVFDNSNSSNLFFWGDFDLTITFTTAPTSGRTIELYLIPALNGSTYSDAVTSNAPANLLVGAFVVRDVTTAQRLTLRGVPLPPHKFRPFVRNNTNQAFATSPGTAHDLEILPYRTQVV